MGLEIKKIIKHPDWKYLLLIIAFACLYGILVYNTKPISLGIGLFSPMNHRELLASIAALPALLLLFLLYRIFYANETTACWSVLLAYPLDQRKHVGLLFLFAGMFQIIPFSTAICIFSVMTQSLSMDFLQFMITLQAIYYVSFFYSCFALKKGYTQTGFSVSIVNPVGILIPAFLFCSILNIGDWFSVFSSNYPYVMMGSFFLLAYLWYRLSWLMRVKLHCSLILETLLISLQNPMIEVMRTKQKRMQDQVFETVISHLSFLGNDRIAALEVSMKQKGYLWILAFMFIGIAISEQKRSYYVVAGAMGLYFYFFYRSQKKIMKKVRIRD